MRQALYRKWRPETFDDVVGQSHITETLRRQVLTDQPAHAYLFVGTRGTGKTTCARILAAALNCEHPENGNPCGKCPSCVGIRDGSMIDVVELDAASNNGVSDVRMLRDEAIYTPASARRRIYIIDEVHMLSTAAFNALLKIIEEPPEHLIFILATTELQKVPATILSRCQRFSFKRISALDTANRLKYIAENEDIRLTDGAAELLSRLADGALRDAVSLLDQCSAGSIVDEEFVKSSIGLAASDDILTLLDAISKEQTGKALSVTSRLFADGKDMRSLINDLISLCRDVLITRLSEQGTDELISGIYSRDALRGFAKVINSKKLLTWLDILRACSDELSRTTSQHVSVELAVIKMCDITAVSGKNAMEARLERIEEHLRALETNGVKITAAAPAEPETPTEELPPLPEEPPLEYEEPVIPDLPKEPAVKVTAQEPEKPAVKETTVPEAKEPEPPESAGNSGSFDGDLWNRLLNAAKDTLGRGNYSALTDSTVKGSVNESGVRIVCEDAFVKLLINKPEIVNAIGDASEKVTGKKLTVKVLVADEPEENQSSGTDKWTRLLNFSVTEVKQ